MKKHTGLKVFVILLVIIIGIVGLITTIIGATSKSGVVVLGVILDILTLINVIYLIAKYNQFIRYSNKVQESLSLIDIHLKLRFDLIPNLVETVKGYAKYESEVFEKITALRTQGLETENEAEKIKVANKMLPEMKSIFAIAEAYPELQAQKSYKKLMDELVECEEKLVASRRIYNSNVNYFNTLAKTFPSNVIASMFGFETFVLYKIETAERILPTYE